MRKPVILMEMKVTTDALPMNRSTNTAKPRSGPAPYLTIAAVWLMLAHLAASFRTIEPVFLWILTQDLLLEKLPGSSRWVTELVWFAAYAGTGLLAWALVEKPSSAPNHRWRRAILSWFVILLVYAVSAIVLVWTGVIAE